MVSNLKIIKGRKEIYWLLRFQNRQISRSKIENSNFLVNSPQSSRTHFSKVVLYFFDALLQPDLHNTEATAASCCPEEPSDNRCTRQPFPIFWNCFSCKVCWGFQSSESLCFDVSVDGLKSGNDQSSEGNLFITEVSKIVKFQCRKSKIRISL